MQTKLRNYTKMLYYNIECLLSCRNAFKRTFESFEMENRCLDHRSCQDLARLFYSLFIFSTIITSVAPT